MKSIILLLFSCALLSAQQIREQNCYSCFDYGPTYFYCQIGGGLGTCCEPTSTSQECNYKSNTTLKCSQEAVGGEKQARPAYCLQNNNSTRCGKVTVFTPDTFRRVLNTTVGALKQQSGDSCLWTITGNRTDQTTGLFLQANSIVTLNVSIFSGPNFTTSRLIASNISSNYNLSITVMNNTYILVAAYNSTATKNNLNFVNLTYYTIPNKFNYSYLDALGYIPTFTAESVKVDEESKFYYVIGCVIGFLILMAMALFMAWKKLRDVIGTKLAELKEKRRQALIIENQKKLALMKAKLGPIDKLQIQIPVDGKNIPVGNMSQEILLNDPGAMTSPAAGAPLPSPQPNQQYSNRQSAEALGGGILKKRPFPQVRKFGVNFAEDPSEQKSPSYTPASQQNELKFQFGAPPKQLQTNIRESHNNADAPTDVERGNSVQKRPQGKFDFAKEEQMKEHW
ncbi:hypothetical protein FGO68_gene2752 [Halteria grandinella]|uniref:Transmembrane protein n=1 Tax=Halteria grandinella TaxID=5974 RepID=A0A8J8NEH7_HALGN|nr:hypothetical protein FGO68_gene2752 [Halteria grandinella]